jgi:hypothetical protein
VGNGRSPLDSSASVARDGWRYNDNRTEILYAAGVEALATLEVVARPGKPTDNGLIESFNGRLRDEFLNVNEFITMLDVREKLKAWQDDYNHCRPHGSLGQLTPSEFATMRSGQPKEAAASSSKPSGFRGDVRGLKTQAHSRPRKRDNSGHRGDAASVRRLPIRSIDRPAIEPPGASQAARGRRSRAAMSCITASKSSGLTW